MHYTPDLIAQMEEITNMAIREVEITPDDTTAAQLGRRDEYFPG